MVESGTPATDDVDPWDEPADAATPAPVAAPADEGEVQTEPEPADEEDAAPVEEQQPEPATEDEPEPAPKEKAAPAAATEFTADPKLLDEPDPWD